MFFTCLAFPKYSLQRGDFEKGHICVLFSCSLEGHQACWEALKAKCKRMSIGKHAQFCLIDKLRLWACFHGMLSLSLSLLKPISFQPLHMLLSLLLLVHRDAVCSCLDLGTTCSRERVGNSSHRLAPSCTPFLSQQHHKPQHLLTLLPHCGHSLTSGSSYPKHACCPSPLV